MKKLNQFLKKSFNKKIDGTGLAVFRIAYTLILLCEIVQLFYFKELIFDNTPFIEEAAINYAIPLGLWFIVVLFILFGFRTRFFTIINYILGLVLIGTLEYFEYHVFYAYMGINFLIIFMPVNKTLSIDRLIEKIKYSNTTYLHNPSKKISQFYYYILPFVGLGIVYMDSMFYKVVTPMWYNGLGSWLPSSLPMVTHVNTSWLLDQEYLVKFIGWFTMLFEVSFLFIFFRKKFRVPVTILGLILHFGIFLEFPIPWFALTACCIYILVVPVSFWERLFKKKQKSTKLTVYYDSECPLCVRTKITVNHLDFFNRINFKTVQFDASENESLKHVSEKELLDNIHSVNNRGKVYKALDTYIQITSNIWYLKPLSLILRLPGIYHLATKVYNYVAVNRTLERCTDENCGYNPPDFKDYNDLKLLKNLTVYDVKLKFWKYMFVFVCLTQLVSISHSWSFERLNEMTGFKDSFVNKAYNYVTYTYLKYSTTYFGLTYHQVFTDRIHFNNYNHIVSVYYQPNNNKALQRLPIIDENGMPDLYNYGANWVNWTFRVVGYDIDQDNLEKGIKKYSAFWAKKNGVDLNDAKFIIKVKKIDAPKQWKDGFFSDQIQNEWIDGGYMLWKNEKPEYHIKDIESL